MTNEQLKQLEDNLWDSANSMRAYGGIKASDYATPVLGLIFLRFADNRYRQFEEEIEKEFNKKKGTRSERKKHEIAVEKCGFFLPPKALYNHLLNLPEEVKEAQAIKDAMEAIEKYQDDSFKGVLPKEAYHDIEKKKNDILPQLLRTFKDIPEDATGDVFGKIYEYFLGKFALAEGQKGGEFFTPTSVVHFIVEVIEPYKGKIFDPACGSGGMFVQSAKFVERANQDVEQIYVEGQEHMGETVRLAKMNLMVNNIRGEVKEVNSYDSDEFKSYGKYDYVMANPPFNVKSVKESTVKDDKRFTEYGLPKNKGKQKEDKIPDANYLWISLFASSLNEKGRAGFVMANSASDARDSEYDIRKRMVDSGIVDAMVTMPSNMFYTVTLPATLWFLDKGKARTNRRDKILFIDGRNVYRDIDRAHREWTEEQVQNLAAIVQLYRGEHERFLELVNAYLKNALSQIESARVEAVALADLITNTAQNILKYYAQVKENLQPANAKWAEKSELLEKLKRLKATVIEIEKLKGKEFHNANKCKLDNAAQHKAAGALKQLAQAYQNANEVLKAAKKELDEILKEADKHLKVKNDKNWSEQLIHKAAKDLNEQFQKFTKESGKLNYWQENIEWLQQKFPDGKYEDVVGLCKAIDREEYVDEHDYSLNAGRYVGIVIPEDNLTKQDFTARIKNQSRILKELNRSSNEMEKLIEERLAELI